MKYNDTHLPSYLRIFICQPLLTFVYCYFEVAASTFRANITLVRKHKVPRNSFSPRIAQSTKIHIHLHTRDNYFGNKNYNGDTYIRNTRRVFPFSRPSFFYNFSNRWPDNLYAYLASSYLQAWHELDKLFSRIFETFFTRFFSSAIFPFALLKVNYIPRSAFRPRKSTRSTIRKERTTDLSSALGSVTTRP